MSAALGGSSAVAGGAGAVAGGAGAAVAASPSVAAAAIAASPSVAADASPSASAAASDEVFAFHSVYVKCQSLATSSLSFLLLLLKNKLPQTHLFPFFSSFQFFSGKVGLHFSRPYEDMPQTHLFPFFSSFQFFSGKACIFQDPTKI